MLSGRTLNVSSSPVHCSVFAVFETAIAVARILSSLDKYSSSTRANTDALTNEPFVVAHLEKKSIRYY